MFFFYGLCLVGQECLLNGSKTLVFALYNVILNVKIVITSIITSLTELPARVRPEPVFFPSSPKSDYVSAIKIVQYCM